MSPLPLYDQRLLRAIQTIVPPAEREEWLLTWQAELWHLHHRHGSRRPSTLLIADLSVGLTCDALWLRTESLRRAFSGTPTLCLACLLGLCLLSAMIALAVTGSWYPLHLAFHDQFDRSLLAAPLVLFVTFATASRRHIGHRPATDRGFWIKRQLFFLAKTSLILLLAFLLSADTFQPLRAPLPNTADLLQILAFVIVAILGLRWTFLDQEGRCKHCLHALATPARVGRPSRNLLEWNGTELLCKHGHGLLSVPEMETSWCQSSQWITPGAGLRQAART